MVFYRKYRPQNIDELDNPNLRETLYSVFSSQSVPHAFLFTGPKGLGKTSAARIIAKVINCEAGIRNKKSGNKNSKKTEAKQYDSSFKIPNSDIEPCNKCSQCVSITNGTNIDILEIDGASNRGIDEIRDLREKIKLSPASAKKKIYIIDEVHMLTTEAFNALLKTLEEPPSHAAFILCTTEPQKVPATISSRCFHIAFKLATADELVRSFKRIVKGEKINIDEDALVLIASLSDGSFRDGSKILQELSSVSDGKKITTELVEDKYQISNIKYQTVHLISLLAGKKTKEGLDAILKLTEQGTDMKYFIEQLVSELHKILLVKAGVNARDTASDIEFSIEELSQLIRLLSKASSEIKYAVLPQLPLELTVIEWGLEKKEDGVEKVTPLTQKAIPASQVFKKEDQSQVSVNFSDEHSTKLSENEDRSLFDKEDILSQLIFKMKSHNHSVAGVLRGCTLKSWDGEKLELTTGFKFHKEKLDDAKIKEIIEKVCKELTGKKVQFSVLLKGKPV